MYSLEWFSDEQMQKVLKYLGLMEKADIKPSKSLSDEEFSEEIVRLLTIIEAFGNCPKSAASAFRSAKEKARAAMDATYEVMLAHILKPTAEHFYASFPTIEQADAFKAKVEEEAGKAYSEIMERDFYRIYIDYKYNQLNGEKTLH